MFELFPAELKELRQWMNWAVEERNGKRTKVPINPHSGFHGSSTDPAAWSTFEHVCSNIKANAAYGAGFVFTRDAGYTGIDLDNIQNPDTAKFHARIYETMNSYTEWSPSSTGLHIFVKGLIPVGKANRENGVEMYCEGRFFTTTGNALNSVPIAPRQAELNALFEKLGGMPAEIVGISQAQTLDDDELLSRAWDAANSDTFRPLWTGADLIDGKFRSSAAYPSQSEADQALINILQFYSKNVEQIERLFKRSALAATVGRKPKPDYYIRHTIRKAFDRELPPIDFSGVAAAVERLKIKASQAVAAPAPAPATPAAPEPQTPAGGAVNPFAQRPPGLLGEIADFVLAQAPFPVPELATAASLAFLAAICGRAFNVSGTGLNLYLLALARTGSGKEAMHSGIGKLVHCMVAAGAINASKLIGPGQISSMPAMMKHLAEPGQQCCVSIIGEFGKRMAKISKEDKAQQIDRDLASAILNLYNKSGISDTSDGIVYSDRVKNMPSIASPAFSILGESAPEPFYGEIDKSIIDGGLLPRFTVIEVEERWQEPNPSAAVAQPSKELINKIRQLWQFCAGCDAASPRQYVPISFSPDAHTLQINYQRDCRLRAFKQSETVNAMWSRAHVKAMKFAALCAIGRIEDFTTQCPQAMIALEDMQFGIRLADFDVNSILLKIQRGAMTDRNSTAHGVQQIAKVLLSYITNIQSFRSFRVSAGAHGANVIEQSVLWQKLGSSLPFSKDPNAFKRCLQVAIEMDIIQPVDANDPRRLQTLPRRAALFQIADVEKLTEFAAS